MNDLSRLRAEYEDRKQRLAGRDLYSWFNTANLFTIQQRQRAVLSTLRRFGFHDLSRVQILEMGSGTGEVLTELLSFGAAPQNLHGVDLLSDRLRQAKQQLPAASLSNADGQNLPYPAQSLDLVLQFTALSSILDRGVQQNICRELLRVLKPSGLVLSYDFWLNPTNPQTHGIHPAELRHLFPGCRYEFRRITLAPPLTRRLAATSWGFCLFLESLKIFNTHYLAAIWCTH